MARGAFYRVGLKTVVGLIAGLGALILGVLCLTLRDMGSFSRRKVDFPFPPQIDAAIAEAQERLKVNSQDIASLVELGTLHFEKGKDFYPDAINDLEEARELGALDPRLFYCLGIMYQEMGLYPFALEEYRRYLRHYPNDKEIRMLLAKLLYKQGHFPEAVGEYERLKFHFPNDPLIEENLGLSLWGAKATPRAVESFNTLKAMGGEESRRAEFYLGVISSEQKNHKEALEHLLRCQLPGGALPHGIEPEKFYAGMATAYQKTGDILAAKDSWEKVLNLTPGDVKAKVSLKEINRILSRKKARKK